jgi:TolA-binding protein
VKFTYFLPLLIVFASLPAHADSIWVSSGAKNALEIPKVQIRDIKDGKIIFVPASGRETSRELSQVVRLSADDDPSLTAGEAAFAAGQWDAATDAYRKVVTSSPKPWARSWSAQRLVESAGKANRFDAAASGYIALLQTDPARAGNFKPAMPDERSTYINTALAEVATALNDAKLTPAQRQALLSFQLDLQRTKKDQKGVGETMEKLLGLGGAAGSDPTAAAALAKLKLDQAQVALEKGDFAGAIASVKAGAASLSEPKDQAQALSLLADAQAGLAAAKNDAGAWQDAALAYMRVVAHFKDTPAASALVVRAMLKTAQIEEKLNDLDGARLLYEQLAAQYPSDPAAAEAKAALQRLKGNR